jgi:hypothetical protein
VVKVVGAAAQCEHLKPEANNEPLNAMLAVGYISSLSESLSRALLNEGAPSVVLGVFVSAKQSHVKSAAAWTLGQVGRHRPEHAGALTTLNALSLQLDGHNEEGAGEDLKLKTKRALKFILEKTTEVEALQALIQRAPEMIPKHVLEQISKLLPRNPKALIRAIESYDG